MTNLNPTSSSPFVSTNSLVRRVPIQKITQMPANLPPGLANSATARKLANFSSVILGSAPPTLLNPNDVPGFNPTVVTTGPNGISGIGSPFTSNSTGGTPKSGTTGTNHVTSSTTQDPTYEDKQDGAILGSWVTQPRALAQAKWLVDAEIAASRGGPGTTHFAGFLAPQAQVGNFGNYTQQVCSHSQFAANPNAAALAIWGGIPANDADAMYDRDADAAVLLRTIPLAVIDQPNGPDALIQDTINYTKMTHPDPRCIASAVALNCAIAMLLSDAPVDEALELSKQAALTVLQEEMRKVKPADLDSSEYQQFTTRSETVLLDCFKNELLNPAATSDYFFVFNSLKIALNAIQTAKQHLDVGCSPIQAYYAAIDQVPKLGGNIAVNVAISSALIGAYLGKQAIPPNAMPRQQAAFDTLAAAKLLASHYENSPKVVTQSVATSSSANSVTNTSATLSSSTSSTAMVSSLPSNNTASSVSNSSGNGSGSVSSLSSSSHATLSSSTSSAVAVSSSPPSSSSVSSGSGSGSVQQPPPSLDAILGGSNSSAPPPPPPVVSTEPTTQKLLHLGRSVVSSLNPFNLYRRYYQ